MTNDNSVEYKRIVDHPRLNFPIQVYDVGTQGVKVMLSGVNYEYLGVIDKDKVTYNVDYRYVTALPDDKQGERLQYAIDMLMPLARTYLKREVTFEALIREAQKL
jgi:hypothetical protein